MRRDTPSGSWRSARSTRLVSSTNSGQAIADKKRRLAMLDATEI